MPCPPKARVSAGHATSAAALQNWGEPTRVEEFDGTRLGMWSHFTSQFSQMVFALLWGFPFLTLGLGYSPTLAGSLLTLMVLAGLVVAPITGQLTAAYPRRRSNLVLAVLVATVSAKPHLDVVDVWEPQGGDRIPVAEVEEASRVLGAVWGSPDGGMAPNLLRALLATLR